MADFYAIDNYPFDRAAALGLLTEFTENENLGRGWLILNDGEVSGYVILTFVFGFEYKGRIAFLDELYISPKAQGKGLGSKTLAFVKEEASGLSLKLIYLEVESHNETAQKLYLSQGFGIHKRPLMKLKIADL
ncbi:MAG: GNAT family N-acetyltransferase [Flavobacterium sp.]|nr:MAG: GNAT family N-acetyltransferase [Flavobacterium sp.]